MMIYLLYFHELMILVRFVSGLPQKRRQHVKQKKNVIIKFDFSAEQTVGEITKIVGLTKAKY
ncbi:MAG: hypothetical protein ACLVKR_06195 [Lachnospiraceae bacterium]